MRIATILSAGLIMGLAIIGCDKGPATTQPSGGEAGSAGGTKQIAVIAKSTVNAYWKAVEAGAKQAGEEEKVEILWTGPDAETNHTQQSNMIDNMVNRGVAGIVLAPTNVDAIVRPVESAVAKGVPVVLIDSTLNSKKPVSVIATDNYKAGQQAAEALAAAIGDKKAHGGKVIMLRFLEGSGSTEAREKGFTDRAKDLGLTVSDAQYTKGGGSATDAADTADAMIRRATQNGAVAVDGIFAANQPTALGMLRTIERAQATGVKIDAPFVGFDAHETLLKGIRDGKVAAIITQDPKQMGYQGVKAMVKVTKGETVEPSIATSTATVTKQNIDDPKIKAITLE